MNPIIMLAVIAQWHRFKNGNTTPDRAHGTEKVWWYCTKKNGCAKDCTHPHEWRATIQSRFRADGTIKVGCPICSCKKVCPCRSLLVLRPDLAKQWYQPLNGNLLPSDVGIGYKKKVHWTHEGRTSNSKCVDGCAHLHIWDANVSNRIKGCDCPLCNTGGGKFCPCQSLEARFPHLAAQWHFSKNDTEPKDHSYGSESRVSWICPDKKCGRSYEARIYDRTSTHKTGCPQCNTNKWEARLASILDAHPLVDEHVKQSIKCYDEVNGTMRMLTPDRIGVFTNGNKFMVETDGEQHFKSVNHFGRGIYTDYRDQVCRDLAKNQFAANNGMSLLRISYIEYSQISMWVHAFLDECSRSSDRVVMTSNDGLYLGALVVYGEDMGTAWW